jgi:hypothetical protein
MPYAWRGWLHGGPLRDHWVSRCRWLRTAASAFSRPWDSPSSRESKTWGTVHLVGSARYTVSINAVPQSTALGRIDQSHRFYSPTVMVAIVGTTYFLPREPPGPNENAFEAPGARGRKQTIPSGAILPHQRSLNKAIHLPVANKTPRPIDDRDRPAFSWIKRAG